MEARTTAASVSRGAAAALIALTLAACAPLRNEPVIVSQDGGADRAAAVDLVVHNQPTADDARTADGASASDSSPDAPADLPVAADLPPAPAGGRAAGEGCAGNQECASGVCADGVCCLTACTDLCRACNVPGNGGTCTRVPPGQPPARAGECRPDTGNPCGNTGKCDGTGSCELAPPTTICGPASCDPGNARLAAESRCDGKGGCQPPGQGLSCAPARCNAARTGCASPCTSNDDCLAPNQCLGGSCGKSDNGLPCTSAEQCKTNFCVDGVCCDGACGGQCEACDVTGSAGTCKAVTGTPHRRGSPARPDCGGDPACPGACDGSNRGRCAYPANRCRSRSCSATSAEVIEAASCNADGVCPPVRTTPCTHVCRAGACTACTPGDRRCSGPSTPQVCDSDGVFKDVSCPSRDNMQPSCAPGGACGLQCEAHMGVVSARLACLTGDICPIWNFETGGTDGWSTLVGSRNGAQPQAVKRNLGGNASTLLSLPVDFTDANPELTIQLTICPAGIGLQNRSFSYRVWMEGPPTEFSFSVFPRAIGPPPDRATDTPNGLSGPARQWIEDIGERFILDVTRDLQIVVRHNGAWSGTAYFDDIRFQ